MNINKGLGDRGGKGYFNGNGNWVYGNKSTPYDNLPSSENNPIEEETPQSIANRIEKLSEEITEITTRVQKRLSYQNSYEFKQRIGIDRYKYNQQTQQLTRYLKSIKDAFAKLNDPSLDVERFEKGDVEMKEYSDVIIINPKGEMLFLQRVSTDTFGPSQFCLPGGGVDMGEKPREAAIREVREEAGLNVDVVFVQSIVDVSRNTLSHYYIASVGEDFESMVVLDYNEHSQYMWVTMEDLDQLPLLLDTYSRLMGQILPQLLTR